MRQSGTTDQLSEKGKKMEMKGLNNTFNQIKGQIVQEQR